MIYNTVAGLCDTVNEKHKQSKKLKQINARHADEYQCSFMLIKVHFDELYKTLTVYHVPRNILRLLVTQRANHYIVLL